MIRMCESIINISRFHLILLLFCYHTRLLLTFEPPGKPQSGDQIAMKYVSDSFLFIQPPISRFLLSQMLS